MGDPQCFVEPVRNENGGVPRVGKPAEPIEKLGGFRRREDGGRFVEDQGVGALRQGFNDL